STARRDENDAALKRIEDALAGRRRELDQMHPNETAAERAARERADTLDRAVENDRVEVAAAAARIDHLGRQIERGDAGPAKPVDTTESDRLGAEIELARRQLAELRATYPEDWPPVVKAVARVDELQVRRSTAANREILEARFAPLRAAIEELRTLSARRDALQQSLAPREEELRRLRALPSAGPRDEASPAVRARQDGAAAAIRDLEALRTRLGLERASGNTVLERFEPASSASMTGAALPLLLLIALAAGAVAGYATEHLAVAVRTEQDIRRYVNLPLLAVVPRIK